MPFLTVIKAKYLFEQSVGQIHLPASRFYRLYYLLILLILLTLLKELAFDLVPEIVTLEPYQADHLV